MRRFGLAIFAVMAVSCTASHPPQTSSDGYKLVWSDEFNHDGPLNPADWDFEHGHVRNNELQFYQPQNATCSNGCLVIEADRKDGKYTSASVNTRGKHSWLYGRFEVRAKIDTRPGSWPAFWTLGVKANWPACGEIDIMEYYRNMLLANVAWAQNGGTNGSVWNTVRKPLTEFSADWSSQFHTWRMDWDHDFIRLYCDEQLLSTQDLSHTLNPDGTNPFHHPHFIMLNQAIGGTAGGDPSQTTFPVRFTIDYLRVYQKLLASTILSATSSAGLPRAEDKHAG